MEEAATRSDISRWFDVGVQQGATHLIVVCDTFDYGDYPVYVKPGEDARERCKEFTYENMQRVMEVYSLSMDKDKQMKEHRAFHYD